MSKVLVDRELLESLAELGEDAINRMGSYLAEKHGEQRYVDAARAILAQPAEAEGPGDWGWLKLAAEVAEEDGPWEPLLGMTDCETAFSQSASPTRVLELIAALSAVTAERDRLEQALGDKALCAAYAERQKLRDEVEAIRKAFGECIQSLHDEMLQSYGGQAPDDMHPVTRRNYDRDMAEIAEYRAAMAAKEG